MAIRPAVGSYVMVFVTLMSDEPRKTSKSIKDGKGLKAKSMKSRRKSRNVISLENIEKGSVSKEGASDGGTLVDFVIVEEGMKGE
eukprot:scaffold1833_cov263-Chaetoceros_neogracile.AAC.8